MKTVVDLPMFKKPLIVEVVADKEHAKVVSIERAGNSENEIEVITQYELEVPTSTSLVHEINDELGTNFTYVDGVLWFNVTEYLEIEEVRDGEFAADIDLVSTWELTDAIVNFDGDLENVSKHEIAVAIDNLTTAKVENPLTFNASYE